MSNYPITGAKLGVMICEAMGLDASQIARIIVDCQPTGDVRVYAEYVNTSPLLDIDWPEVLKGVVPISNKQALTDKSE